jgi:GTP pyrophosphokinase
VGAKANGRIVPLKYKLRNGDIVEITTQANHTPSRDWLALVKTSRARNKIKHWVNLAQRQQAVEIGKKLLEKEARKYDVVLKKISEEDYQRVARDYGCTQTDDLYASLGYGKFAAGAGKACSRGVAGGRAAGAPHGRRQAAAGLGP